MERDKEDVKIAFLVTSKVFPFLYVSPHADARKTCIEKHFSTNKQEKLQKSVHHKSRDFRKPKLSLYASLWYYLKESRVAQYAQVEYR